MLSSSQQHRDLNLKSRENRVSIHLVQKFKFTGEENLKNLTFKYHQYVYFFLSLFFWRKLSRKIDTYFQPKLAQCLKIREKVSFNITSEVNYNYILSGQKLIKNSQNVPWFFEIFENLKPTVKQCYQTSHFEYDKNWSSMPKFKNSNATFWVIFKHCDLV